ncbi:SAM-dependent methyltransferase [Paenibacillus agaridevorans]|uniref:SAM-dependent methyltransferase n=1 Tax=Paenibacillus agaridevorans TaxID=171404 RepID=A0A2R5EMA4_9BACL|nr:class I SAM-dependent methyltransferase [Paenibacillus agaridevorans]GBG06769.1 SAM-dependent methyltransferase [Paenibacillus agaridevorans]
MGFLSVLSTAHKWIAERAGAGDIVVDATAGGGVDTFALAELVGPKGMVYAFDIQQEALERTRLRLAPLAADDRLPGLKLILADHAEMVSSVDASDAGRIAAVMFNLGYLPGGDTTVITKPESTLRALDAALSLIRPGGIMTCVLYPGHPGGDAEAAAVEAWAANLPQNVAQAVLYRQPQRTTAPYLIAIERRKG